MKYLCALFFVIGIVGSAPTGNRCVESCSNISVDDIINLIISRKIDVFSLLSKIQALVGSSTGGTGSSNHYEISGSFSPFTSVNAAGLAKLLSGLSNPTLAKVVDTITDFTGIELDTSEISPDNLNKPFDLTPLVKQLYSSNGPVSLRSILNAVQQATNSSPGTTNETGSNNNDAIDGPSGTVGGNSNGVNLTSTSENTTLSDLFPADAKVNGTNLYKILSSAKKPTVSYFIQLLERFSGSTIDKSKFLSSILNKTLDSSVIEKLSAFSGNVPVKTLLSSLSLTSPSSSSSSSFSSSSNGSNGSSGTANQNGSGSSSVTFDGFVPADAKVNLKNLYKVLSSAKKPTVSFFFEILGKFSGLTIYTNKMPKSVLNQTLDSSFIEKLASLGETVSVQTALNILSVSLN
ncbi:uncharacterized protein LOC116346159 [Contarinia nasturtii]|uniref:uncharacterized protein LOC116346159 n=1 Tax=Contarinia nasturtii TaxID=265458 RepID=UPI0012D3C229|nr:uncharacterized protein LOC116346159 [Contarinia nasturtii]